MINGADLLASLIVCENYNSSVDFMTSSEHERFSSARRHVLTISQWRHLAGGIGRFIMAFLPHALYRALISRRHNSCPRARPTGPSRTLYCESEFPTGNGLMSRLLWMCSSSRGLIYYLMYSQIYPRLLALFIIIIIILFFPRCPLCFLRSLVARHDCLFASANVHLTFLFQIRSHTREVFFNSEPSRHNCR